MSTQNPNSTGHHPRPPWTPASTRALLRIAVGPGLRKWQNQPRTATVAPATLACLICLLILPLTPAGLAYGPLAANLGRQPIGPAAAPGRLKAAERQRTAQARLGWRLMGALPPLRGRLLFPEQLEVFRFHLGPTLLIASFTAFDDLFRNSSGVVGRCPSL